MAGCDILFVRIRIDPVTLNEREKARGDRTIGKAAWQLEHITPKEDGAYDLVVSTDRPSVECARQILQKAYPEL